MDQAAAERRLTSNPSISEREGMIPSPVQWFHTPGEGFQCVREGVNFCPIHPHAGHDAFVLTLLVWLIV